MNLKQHFLNLRIRLKLLIAFGSILLMSVILIAIAVRSISLILTYKQISEKIDAVALQITKINRTVTEFQTVGFKDSEFQSTKESNLIRDFYTESAKLSQSINYLKSHQHLLDENSIKQIRDIEITVKTYHHTFEDLVELLAIRGFKDHGLEGELREAIHKVEDADFPYDKATMLMLRRHEKDFFLRKDLKYLEPFNSLIEKFETRINSIQLNDNEEVNRAAIINSLNEYKSKFNRVVELEKEIGLSSEAGKVGTLTELYNEINPELMSLVNNVKDKAEAKISEAYFLLVIVFLIQLLIGIVLVVFYSGLLTKTIKEIRSGMVALSDGRFPEKLTIRSTDELAQTKIALNQLVDRIKTAALFAKNLGEGQLNAEYDERYANDVLAKAIQNMQQELLKANEKQIITNWRNEGLARFSDILKNEGTDIKVICEEIIINMVKYLKLNQGALYIYREEEEDKYLERIATYAYERKKYIEHRVAIGEGIAGQVFLEGEAIYLKELPQNFVKISSGLGEATPSMLFVVPLKIRDEVNGIVELAGFNELQDYEQDFVKRVSESIANIISNKQQADKTKKLLQESQEKAEQLASQEEELRQNSEELQATQEEMHRQRKELEDKIIRLESELELKDQLLSKTITS